MPKQLFGVHVMHPMDVQSPLFNDTLQKIEQKPMTFFEDGVYALKYGLQVARDNGVQATKTPVGPDTKCEVLPGIAIVYRVSCDERELSKMSSIRTKEIPNVNSYVGLLNHDNIKEQMGILARTRLHKMETCEISDVQMALAKRWQTFVEFERALSQTPKELLSKLDMEYTNSSLSMMYGVDGFIANGFVTEIDCDKCFNDVIKTLWENNAGLHYISQIDRLYNSYRDGYAWNVVCEGMSKESAAAKASLGVISKIKEITTQYGDEKIEEALNELSEEVSVKYDLREDPGYDER